MSDLTLIDSKESIVRLLNQEWIVSGVLQQTAFQLRPGETYLSVNRPLIESYDSDVAEFIKEHPNFKTEQGNNTYCRASMNVGEVRGMELSFKGNRLNVNVEVEPRASHTKSHAGIFARFHGKNIKGGQNFLTDTNYDEPISVPDILQKMRWQLLQLSHLEVCEIK
jgi:hypothetical protein